MEFRHLETFQAIIEAGSFLQAAEKLQYAQSTITLHIQQLEAELNVKLFSRRGKKVQLTTAGRALSTHAVFCCIVQNCYKRIWQNSLQENLDI